MCIHAKPIFWQDVHEHTTGQQISSLHASLDLQQDTLAVCSMQIFRQVASMNSSHIVQVCSV
jgi:hypothetical protein